MKTKFIALFLLLSLSEASNAAVCAIQTYSGNYLTAVGGGGRITDVLHSDARQIGAWEKFTIVKAGADGGAMTDYGIRTVNGHYLTAVGRGGRITDVVHSDAVQLKEWERFSLLALGNGSYAIQTADGHFLTAVGGGGRVQDVIHSDATRIGAWEMFRFRCGL